MSFSVTTYNVLADAYANRAWYPRTPALVLDPTWRVPALVQYIAAIDAEIICLQEVELASWPRCGYDLARLAMARNMDARTPAGPMAVRYFIDKQISTWSMRA